MASIEERVLLLEPGSRYVLRNGLITGELTLGSNGTNYRFEADVQESSHRTLTKACWLPSGRYLTNTVDHRLDIVSKHHSLQDTSHES